MNLIHSDFFDAERIYDDSDDELDLIAPKTQRAQWRHLSGVSADGTKLA